MGGNKWFDRRARTDDALEFGLGAESMMALIDKGLPKWCWACPFGPYNDNLLQYIIGPVSAPQRNRFNEEANGKLCILLAERFSLEELCREDEHGLTALDHACRIHDYFGDRAGGWNSIWIEFHRVVAQRMVPCVREFQGSLPKLIDLSKCVDYGLQGNWSLLRTVFEGKSEPYYHKPES